MIPAGTWQSMFARSPDFLQAAQVTNIYSVSPCISDDFADYMTLWKHNGYWLFDSPEIILAVARENSIDVTLTTLFY